MQLPKILQGESLTRLLQGAFAGFLATVVSFPKIPSGPDSHRKTESSHH